ncbi:ABC transporter ATP-binding protein [Phytohabitans houttuyneae]|uniref:Dipeptide/oligopeptide/nickel ABC transporter ATP-binding protein n=1 Tax=Phytohabitans houttuyneae TaxID=1076126 RepID=A0A6V8KML8_9ACTN|nr:ATP-binding cassette domain-containing protein [Phytohabitans houttuyneae]GFJ82977.1 dipeptide/oligopeptide/nickel ABC transporter ATP-binding protein [Phytohabitans houttuyneae]
MNSGALIVRGLTVRYGGRTVVDNVDLDVTDGRVLGLVGESGSGKSTIARAVLGLAPVHAGTITVGGYEVRRLSARERARRVQMIFQDPFGSLNPRMSVGGIIREGLEALGDLPPRARAAEVTRLLELVSLSPDLAQRLPRRLSGGQRQRVAIARALAARPGVLIADEITSALDVSVQAQVLNVLRGILAAERFSMLFISHNLAVVRYISDDIAVMREGVIVETGPVDEVLAAPRHPYTRELLAAIPQLHPAA